MTLSDLSKSLGANRHRLGIPALSRIESGLRRVDADDLVAICHALGLSPNDLLGYEPRPGSGLSVDVAPEWLDKFLGTAAALQQLYGKGSTDGND